MKQANHESAKKFVNEISNGNGKMTDKSAKAYYREFTKVMEAADVVLQVCDARDPMGTRCKQVEETVMNSTSKGVLIKLQYTPEFEYTLLRVPFALNNYKFGCR